MTSEISKNLDAMNFQQLETLIKNARGSQEKIKTDLKKSLGQLFLNHISVDKFLSFKQVNPKEIGIENESVDYPKGTKPSHFKTENVVMGFCDDRPFIAVRMDILDKNLEKITEVVEILFKRFKGNQNILWVTNTAAMEEKGEFSSSLFYGTGGMSEEQLEAFGNVLNMNTVKSPVNDEYSVRLTPSKF